MLVLSSKANAKKVEALNYGSPPHSIDARTKPYLKFPRSPARGATGGLFTPSPFASIHASDMGPYRRKDHVDHPGIAPGQFMEDAMTRVIRRTLHRSIVLKDRRNAALRV